jgi:protein ImuA
MTASRRLQLAVENSGSVGIAVPADFGQPTASVTRERPALRPRCLFPTSDAPGGCLNWIRCRAGDSADFEVEACDAEGRLAFPSNLVHGPGAKEVADGRASA